MNFLYGPDADIWVAASDRKMHKGKDRAIQSLLSDISHVQVWFCDLDDNHTQSVAKKMAYNQVGTNILDPSFLWWSIHYGFPAFCHKPLQTKAWRKFIGTSLQNEKATLDLDKMLTPDKVFKSLFPGVATLHSILPGERIYVTRNIGRVAHAYADLLGFSGYVPNAYDKGGIVELLLQQNPWIDTIGITGDSIEDGEMIDAAWDNNCNVVSIYTMKVPECKKLDARFSYATSRNRAGLVHLLQRSN